MKGQSQAESSRPQVDGSQDKIGHNQLPRWTLESGYRRFRLMAPQIHAACWSSREDRPDDLSVHVSQPEVPPGIAVGKFLVIHSEEMKNGCV